MRATERAVSEQSAVLTRERYPLFDALIDDLITDFSQPINIRLAGTKIAALDRVVEQPVKAVTIVLIIFRRIDSALGRNRVRAPRRVLKAKASYSITQFAQGRRRRASGQTAPNDDDFELSPIIWTNQS